MPSIVNNLMAQIWALIKNFFQANKFEFGVLEVSATSMEDCEQTISLTTKESVQKVWFEMEPKGGAICGGGQNCWISDPEITPQGFSFRIKVHTSACIVRWFAIL